MLYVTSGNWKKGLLIHISSSKRIKIFLADKQNNMILFWVYCDQWLSLKNQYSLQNTWIWILLRRRGDTHLYLSGVHNEQWFFFLPYKTHTSVCFSLLKNIYTHASVYLQRSCKYEAVRANDVEAKRHVTSHASQESVCGGKRSLNVCVNCPISKFLNMGAPVGPPFASCTLWASRYGASLVRYNADASSMPTGPTLYKE